MTKHEFKEPTSRSDRKLLIGIGTVAASGLVLFWGLGGGSKLNAQPKSTAPDILQIVSPNGVNQGPLFEITQVSSPDPGSEVAEIFAEQEGLPNNSQTRTAENQAGTIVGQAMTHSTSPLAGNYVLRGQHTYVAPTEAFKNDANAVKQLESIPGLKVEPIE